MSGFITLITRAVVPDPFFTLSSFTCAVGIACAFASVRCVCDSLCMLRFPELALVQAYSHVYCAICLLVAASLDRSALRCADRGRWHEQHLLSSAAFSCCCRSHGRWHIANLLCMSSMLLHLIALLFAVRAGAWKACACIPCAACAASETDCLLGSCLLFLSALLFLQQQHLLSSVAFSCCCRSHGRWHIANLLFMSSTLLHLIALLFAVQAGAWKACTCIPCAGYFSTLLSHSLPLRKFQLRTRLHLMSVLLLLFPAA